ncbi:hypothetical protein ACFY1B_49465 [Streptomyces mirabilis]|uniref:Immunity protein 50 n=1 Tax=Streptomyces mirabilis TaxID=68239 RepID=A0ABU3V7A9_9ACTN|nr:hypothetical protein [Streptomyces mirabilis]MCX4419274.1 hypothetical protein [Streptomyces mirabilis]MCX5356787.1 hypothetical protein [Streptomyces mirabilis]MDU9001900.1 hypothetical protein [Streptomyces mirabilis]
MSDISIRLVEDASDDSYVLDILDITLTPAWPRLGHQLRCEMDGRLKETVDLTRVTCNVIMKIGPVKMLERSYRLPDLLADMGAGLSGETKPPAGPWKHTWNLRIPETVPVAEHRIHLRARTGDGKDFFALDIPVDFSRRFHLATTSAGVGSRVLHGPRCRRLREGS